MSTSDPIITLDVGGKLFKTTKSTLVSNSTYFSSWFTRYKDNDFSEPLFIDRSPENFYHILEYMRNPLHCVPKDCLVDMDYFGVDSYDEDEDDDDEPDPTENTDNEFVDIRKPHIPFSLQSQGANFTSLKQRTMHITPRHDLSYVRKFTASGIAIEFEQDHVNPIITNVGIQAKFGILEKLVKNLKKITITSQSNDITWSGDFIRLEMLLRKQGLKHDDCYLSLDWLFKTFYCKETTKFVVELNNDKDHEGCKLIYSKPCIDPEELLLVKYGYDQTLVDYSLELTSSQLKQNTVVKHNYVEYLPTRLVCIESRDYNGELFLPIKSITLNRKDGSPIAKYGRETLQHDKIHNGIKNHNAPVNTISLVYYPLKINMFCNVPEFQHFFDLNIEFKKNMLERISSVKVYFVRVNFICSSRD